MFGKKKEQKKEVWLVIEQIDYSDSQSFYVAKSANSLENAVAFKVSLDQLNGQDAKSYFIATKAETAMDKVITLHNQKVVNDNK